MEHEFEKQFTRCPVCKLREELAQILGKPELAPEGREERFCEEMGDELKERGLARKEWNFHMDVKQGVVVDQQKVANIPIGSEVPQFGFMTDICLECGNIYAADIDRKNAKITADVSNVIPQNRAQRRRDARQGDGPQFPFSPS